jgi:hypothetical protein
MTVSSIVQGLLEKGHITAEEAMVLLKAELNKPCFPTFPAMPYSPPYPNLPFVPHVGDPIPRKDQIWYSSGTGGTSENVYRETLNDNLTSK